MPSSPASGAGANDGAEHGRRPQQLLRVRPGAGHPGQHAGPQRLGHARLAGGERAQALHHEERVAPGTPFDLRRRAPAWPAAAASRAIAAVSSAPSSTVRATAASVDSAARPSCSRTVRSPPPAAGRPRGAGPGSAAARRSRCRRSAGRRGRAAPARRGTAGAGRVTTASYARRRCASGLPRSAAAAPRAAWRPRAPARRARPARSAGRVPDPLGGQRDHQPGDRLDDRLQEQRALGLVAPGGQHPAGGPGVPGHLVGEPGLADAGLAADQHRRAPRPAAASRQARRSRASSRSRPGRPATPGLGGSAGGAAPRRIATCSSRVAAAGSTPSSSASCDAQQLERRQRPDRLAERVVRPHQRPARVLVERVGGAAPPRRRPGPTPAARCAARPRPTTCRARRSSLRLVGPGRVHPVRVRLVGQQRRRRRAGRRRRAAAAPAPARRQPAPPPRSSVAAWSGRCRPVAEPVAAAPAHHHVRAERRTDTADQGGDVLGRPLRRLSRATARRRSGPP